MRELREDWRASSKWQRAAFLVILLIELWLCWAAIKFCLLFTDALNKQPDPALAFFILMLAILWLVYVLGRIKILSHKEEENV